MPAPALTGFLGFRDGRGEPLVPKRRPALPTFGPRERGPPVSVGSCAYPPDDFKHFLLSFQSSFHLSLAVLVRYRKPGGI
jgi:hypothetical protein